LILIGLTVLLPIIILIRRFRLIWIELFSNQQLKKKGLFEASPNLHFTILKRIVFYNKVINHERIVDRKGFKDDFDLVIIYAR
jgi:hypothetical protein